MSARESLEAEWLADKAKHPNMEKATFVRNKLFGLEGIYELAQWLKDDPDFAGQVMESTYLTAVETLTRPDPDRAGWSTSQMDLSRPYVVASLRIEVVTDGHSKIQRGIYGDWDDYGD